MYVLAMQGAVKIPGLSWKGAVQMLGDILRFIGDPQHAYWQHTVDTLKLCFVPIILSLLIALPLGVLVAQRPFIAFIATNASGLIRAIPTLAVLAVIILYLKQIGFIPSVIALTALGIPPILLNTIAGLRGIDPASIDAARGMGMTPLQMLWRIRIPLVMPVVAAGVRTSAVQIVATMPIAAYVGGGGYGEYIFLGLSGEAHLDALLVGGISVALLALLVEFGFAALQRAVTPVGLRTGQQQAVTERSTAATAVSGGTPLAA
jgi:osmoprotectant transport system permease protein